MSPRRETKSQESAIYSVKVITHRTSWGSLENALVISLNIKSATTICQTSMFAISPNYYDYS